MNNRMRTVTLVIIMIMFVFTTSCYLIKTKRGIKNYAVLTTDDWTFTEYVFPNAEKLEKFLSQVNRVYDQEEDVDFQGALREYLSLKKLSRYSAAIKRIYLEEIPPTYSMPYDALLTFVKEGEVAYRRDVYESIMKEFEKKKIQQAW